MPKANDAKTESAPKPKRELWPVLAFIAAAVFLAVAIFVVTRPRLKTLRVDGHIYKLTVASTASAQEKGLGGRASMPVDQGMVFVYGGEGQRCFWMKGMRFSLDMIWLDSNKRVVSLLPDVSPDTFPKAFCPTQPSQYVIELNAGQAAATGINTGEKLNF